MTEKMMTIEEFENLYRDVELKFSSYYKYVFTFTGKAPDGTEISAYYGGQDAIYRYSVSANEVLKVGNSIRRKWNAITATRNGEDVFSYYDF